MPETRTSPLLPRAARRTLALAVVALLALMPGSALALRYASPTGTSTTDCKTPQTACDLATAIHGVTGNMPVLAEEVVVEPGEYAVASSIEEGAPSLYVHGAPGTARPVLVGSVPQILHAGNGGMLAYLDIEEHGTSEAVFSHGATLEGMLVRGKPMGSMLCRCNDGTILDSVFVNLPGSGDGAVGVSSNGGEATEILRNDTIYSEATSAPAIKLEQQAASGSLSLLAINTIAVNAAGGNDVFASKLATITLTHSDYAKPFVEGTGEVIDEGGHKSAPPLFANPAAADFRELPGSPTIDTGLTEEANGLLDFGGGPRQVGAATDIGALEYQPPATTVTGAASSVSATTAVLGGSVDPNGAPVSGCSFEYGATEAYGSSAPCQSGPGAGSAPVAVAGQLAGLSPSTTYHYRLVASNSDSTSAGGDQVFTTAAAPPGSPPAGASSAPPPPAAVRLAFALGGVTVAINPKTRTGTLLASCRGPAGTRCTLTGTLYATAAVLARTGAKPHLKAIGTVTATIAAGAMGRLRVKLTRSALRTLHRRRRLTATLAAKAVDQGETVRIHAAVRLKLASSRRR